MLSKPLTDKQAVAKQKREDAKAEKKMQADLKKTSNDLVTAATKVVTSVEPLLVKLQKAWDSLDKITDKEEIDTMTVDNLRNKIEWAKAILEESQKIMKLVSSGKLADKKDFATLHGSDIGPEIKSCNLLLKSVAYAKKAARTAKKGGA